MSAKFRYKKYIQDLHATSHTLHKLYDGGFKKEPAVLLGIAAESLRDAVNAMPGYWPPYLTVQQAAISEQLKAMQNCTIVPDTEVEAKADIGRLMHMCGKLSALCDECAKIEIAKKTRANKVRKL